MGTLSATVHLYKHDAKSAKGYTLPNIMFAAVMPQFLFRRKNTILSVTYQAKKHQKKLFGGEMHFYIFAAEWKKMYFCDGDTPEYWAGWALAFYQWFSARSFEQLQRDGLSIEIVISLYPTHHEADLTKFAQTADAIIREHTEKHPRSLKMLRKEAHLTQQELSELSGVTLRMIQAYEQGDQDIRRAEARTVFALARVLGCRVEMLFG